MNNKAYLIQIDSWEHCASSKLISQEELAEYTEGLEGTETESGTTFLAEEYIVFIPKLG